MDKNKTNTKQVLILFSVGELILFIMLIIGTSYILQYINDSNNNKKIYQEIYNEMTNESLQLSNTEKETTVIPNNVQKVINLKKENKDVIGWIQIDNTIIDYPLLQSATDKDYYLTHNYKKNKSKYGSIYLNKSCDIEDKYSNCIIYGHNMKDEQMFNTLLKYESKEFYNKNKKIRVATENGENEYLIVCAFKSKVFYQDEKNVFRYYNYINFENEEIFNTYIQNCKKIQLYDTGVNAEYGEQLITLVTCEYSQENGRFVVVAKKLE